MSARPPHPLSWKIRLGALAAAIVLALGLLPLWAGGVKFMKLVAKVSQQIADSSAPPPEPAAQPAPPETPGVVSVGILPPPPKSEKKP